ncbi:Cobalt-precorrin-6y C5-methyltransferase [Caenispirillum salinarum AK4]|uniref:Cobalt-precorrin-6y C5-methyltransferase n=1 Tax=Caenispirillum salinarum AK4 TaxID=1238182 RepID=K9GP19_9PROT|nr:bifunctional cobalt-precorrin-7 (C(5))-methyltransferase/cobalt-precorrin-6B (C(15))-methyltransferase [Caenispirillum salinarum]EKV26892.1 Cobalt-precorrin-6y C5-methyltransferase [Caenispirillum salinarum AK4]
MIAPAPWLTVVGIGEDGLDGLSPAARSVVEEAAVLAGGARHLALAPETDAVRIEWSSLEETLAAIESRRGTPGVVVLASGDPMLYGLGATLARRFDPAEMVVLPHASAFSLAAARMGWPVQDCRLLTVHGRPLEGLIPHLTPGARLLVLSADGTSPAAVAALLTRHGFGPSAITALWHMGGPREGRREGTAEAWDGEPVPDLNTLAVACEADAGARVLPRTPGLPDDAFRHDGQLTKRVARAATVSALAPLPGQVLWDIGAGCGSVAIEWMRAADGAQAVAVELHAGRRAMIAENAATLGTPGLRVVAGEAPAALAEAGPAPDAVFVGGGVSRPGMLDAAWNALKPGGRLVANAVTAEAEARLIDRRAAWNGTLTRISASHLKETPGGLHVWDALAPVTQLVAVKP